MTQQLPQLNSPGAYDRLRKLQRARRRATRFALILLIANLLALAAYVYLRDAGRY